MVIIYKFFSDFDGRNEIEVMDRLIFHVDVNSAFLSWEATKRVKNGEEDIRLIPSCISGDPSKRTSIVLAKSQLAKKYGIITGESIASAIRKCPNLYIARPDFVLYEEYSRAFKNICRKYAEDVEEYSIDECFMDMTGTKILYPNPIKTAYEIKDLIKKELGFTVNIGIGPNKLLAKMAGDFEKPDKVHTLFLNEIESKMWPLPVRELILVGKNTANKLEDASIKTIGDLAITDLKLIKSLVGDKAGQQIYEYANGIDESKVEGDSKQSKGYSAAITFEEDITDIESLNKVLMGLSDSICTRIRKDKVRVRSISVNIRFMDFRNKSHQVHLDYATDITKNVYQISKKLLDELWDKTTPIRLIGLSLGNISNDSWEQLNLFDNEKKEKQRKVDETMDLVRSKFGMDKIIRGSLYGENVNIGKKFKAKYDSDINHNSDKNNW